MSNRNTITRLRRLAQAEGYDFHKSRKAESSENFGGFMLTHMATNTVVSGSKYELSLDDVRSELEALEVEI